VGHRRRRVVSDREPTAWNEPDSLRLKRGLFPSCQANRGVGIRQPWDEVKRMVLFVPGAQLLRVQPEPVVNFSGQMPLFD
jgi:hypothetical protein